MSLNISSLFKPINWENESLNIESNQVKIIQKEEDTRTARQGKIAHFQAVEHLTSKLNTEGKVREALANKSGDQIQIFKNNLENLRITVEGKEESQLSECLAIIQTLSIQTLPSSKRALESADPQPTKKPKPASQSEDRKDPTQEELDVILSKTIKDLLDRTQTFDAQTKKDFKTLFSKMQESLLRIPENEEEDLPIIFTHMITAMLGVYANLSDDSLIKKIYTEDSLKKEFREAWVQSEKTKVEITIDALFTFLNRVSNHLR